MDLNVHNKIRSRWLIFTAEFITLIKKEIMLKSKYLLCKMNAFFFSSWSYNLMKLSLFMNFHAGVRVSVRVGGIIKLEII